MKSLKVLFILTLVFSLKLQAQVDTTKPNNLLDEITLEDKEVVPLLPSRMIITQRLMWGKHGMMRNFDNFELTPEKRQKELKLRRTLLVTHQVLGFATMGAMIAQGIVGAKLYSNGGENLEDLHKNLAVAVNTGYFTAAGLSLFAPPKMVNERKGYSSIKVHKWLALVHMTAMIATNVLAGQTEGPNGATYKPYHRAAAYTAFGAFAASMIIIKF
jgi:hypothetical protein